MSYATFTVHHGSALQIPEPDASVHCVVTSPPYYGLRDYGIGAMDWPAVSYLPMAGVPCTLDVPAMSCQLGLEPTPEAFIGHMVLVFREVRRVLREDGTCWINMGDSYAGNGAAFDDASSTLAGRKQSAVHSAARRFEKMPTNGLKPKDLMMIPARLALALQADGWWLRMDNVWSKPNSMPESVTDRCTKAHEYVFHLAKSGRYYYDGEAVKEPTTGNAHPRGRGTHPKSVRTGVGVKQNASFSAAITQPVPSRNKRSVWSVPTRAYGGDHYATYNPDLIEPCILAGTSAAGCCPECGAPWERQMAQAGEVSYRGGRRKHADVKRRQGASGVLTTGKVALHITVGWAPTCDCPAPALTPCTVLDPFSGHATTGVAALRNGRRYVGVEANARDVGESVARLRDVQPPLLVDLTAAAAAAAPRSGDAAAIPDLFTAGAS